MAFKAEQSITSLVLISKSCISLKRVLTSQTLSLVILHDHVFRSNDTMRRQRLDDVRHLFVQQYCAVMDSCSGASNLDGASLSSGSSGGMLTGLLENFAEKVGIRPARSGFY